MRHAGASRRDWFRACAAWPLVAGVPGPAAQHGVLAAHRARTVQPPWTIGPFTRELRGRPILTPRAGTRFMCPAGQREVNWEEKDVFNPAAVVRDGLVHLLYRAQDSVGRPSGTSRIGLATSRDGLQFERRATPVLYPDNDALAAVRMGGRLRRPARGGNRQTAATSSRTPPTTARRRACAWRHRLTWSHGRSTGSPSPRLAEGGIATSGRSRARLSASHAALVPSPSRIDGRYWMYWGDTDIFVATSDDLLEWTPLERAPGAGEVAANHPTLFTALAPRAPQVRQRPRRARAAADADGARDPAAVQRREQAAVRRSADCPTWPTPAARPCSTRRHPAR